MTALISGFLQLIMSCRNLAMALTASSFWSAMFKILMFDLVMFRVPNTFIPAILYNMASVFCLLNYVVQAYI